MKTIVLDKVVGDFGADDEWLREELNKANGEDIKLELSSPGGYVYPGLSMFNLLKNYQGKVWTHIMGLAASMASYIALAGEKITAEANAVFMIHNVQGMVVGDHNDMSEAADIFGRFSNLLARTYADRTGKKLTEIQSLMDNTTYFFGDEMKDAGFVDEIISVDKKESKDDAVAYAQLMIEDCISKMKKNKNENDLLKIAALLPIDTVTSYSSSAKLVDESWDAGESEKRWRTHAKVESSDDLPNATYQKRFAWFDSANKKNFGAYKFPHWDYKDGEFVNVAAVRNGLARLSQSDIPAAEKSKVESLLRKYLDRFNKDKEAKNPAGAGDNKLGGVKMTLEELKAQHPHLYDEIFKAGKEAAKAEMQRNIDAHLEWIEADQQGVINALKNGEQFDYKHLSAYNKSALKNQAVKDREDDDPDDVTVDDKNKKEAFGQALDKAIDERFGIKPEGGK